LSPDDARRGALTFKMVRPRTAAAHSLVRQAQKQGARTVAILAPESSYGRAMADALKDAAQKTGLRVVADVRYPEAATTFIDPVQKLKNASPDALVIPAPASSLALIAPQLTASGLSRLPGVKPLGKTASVFATADGINAGFVASTAKYLQGAVLAPTFYPDLSDPRINSFVDRYRAAYGEEPTVLDALAFDAVRAVRIALDHEGGQPSRGALATQVAHLGESGVTGELAFTASGERGGLPPLFVVEGDALRALK
jgi:branched-chain amino acid transport system substrate-binding protein